MDFDWKINGGHKQKTREGYNLLDFNVTQNGSVTYNKEDGTVTINGQGGFTLNFTKTILQANKKYKAKIELVSGTIKDSSGNDMLDNSIMINFKWLNPIHYSILINENDTSNLLSTISFIRELVNMIDAQAASASLFNLMSTPSPNPNTNTLE